LQASPSRKDISEEQKDLLRASMKPKAMAQLSSGASSHREEQLSID